jgi:TolB protein
MEGDGSNNGAATLSGSRLPRMLRAAALSLVLVAAVACDAASPETATPASVPASLPNSPSPLKLDGATKVEVGEPIDVRELDGWIVFDDFDDVFVVRADGTGLRPVADRRGPEFDAAWSPDGRRIVYRDSRRGINEDDEIVVVDADGTGARNVSRSPSNEWGPDWSPDGRTIVYNSDRGDGTPSGFLVSPDGSDRHRIAIDGWVEYPSFSPDGTRIAFMGHDGADYDIYVAELATGEVTRLTEAPGSDGWPVWSPDGSRIAFASERDDCLHATDAERCWTADEPGEHHDVWVMNADGSAQRRVTPEFGHFVAWSPDGSHLLVSGYDLFVIRPDGTGRATVVPRGGGIPDWIA